MTKTNVNNRPLKNSQTSGSRRNWFRFPSCQFFGFFQHRLDFPALETRRENVRTRSQGSASHRRRPEVVFVDGEEVDRGNLERHVQQRQRHRLLRPGHAAQELRGDGPSGEALLIVKISLIKADWFR